MKKSIFSKLLLMICLAVLFGCKAKKQIIATHQPDTLSKTVAANQPDNMVKAVAVTVDNTKTDKLNAIRLKQVNFNTFTGKAAAKLNIDGKENNATLNIRIKKNQEIWVSVTAIVGIEVGRAVITPDSIKVINRLQGTYIKQPFSYIYGYTSNQINYQILESLLLGNAAPGLVNDQATLQPGNGNVIVSGNLHELAYQLFFNPDLLLLKTNMQNPAAGQMLQVGNSAFVQAGAVVMPSQISISSASKDNKIQIEMHYNKTAFNQVLEFPFTIPARYTAVN